MQLRSSNYRQDGIYWFFFLLFTISGFAGLIYQSIWSHYVKLLLGHAAFSQTLVLVVFMGGLAAGSWIVSALSHRCKNLLRVYASIEFAIGLYAIAFHRVFVAVHELTLSTVLPALGPTPMAEGFKLGVGVILILPPSILIGMTFPLVAGALSRILPERLGYGISGLYFSNSLGAAIGVAASGFVLIATVGLPGTLLTSGILNILLAMAAASASKLETNARPGTVPGSVSIVERTATGQVLSGNRFPKYVISVAILTGAATFVYEIAWIRLLSLVLGSSSHAFELMICAMILGISLGSWRIRRRLDSGSGLLGMLSIVLVLKGVLAVATLPLYSLSFDVMRDLLMALSKTESAYSIFNFSSLFISMAVMVPSAFFAGMSLPILMTHLSKSGQGERAYGQVYGWNTLGAILGVLFAVNVGFSVFGLKSLIVAASILDVGAALIAFNVARKSTNWRIAAAGFSAVAIVLACGSTLLELDALKMASGIYRDGQFFSAGSTKVLFAADGKTATINVLEHVNGVRSISTNGKSDAALQMVANRPPESDEYTMILAGALPLAYRPDAKNIANIGFGSGLTTHTLLGSNQVALVESIEIEPKIIDGARLFGSRVERAFLDPRSKIIVDDAKSHFAGRQNKYDVIISEPSNPWVSGVAGLFSVEFYSQIKRHLSKGGILVQWVQLYETDLSIVSSIMRALDSQFHDYHIYDLSGSEMLIVASPDRVLGPLYGDMFGSPKLAADLARIGISSKEGFEEWRFSGKAAIAPLFAVQGSPVNSDYFPFVDQNAAKARFMRRTGLIFSDLIAGDVPVLDILDSKRTALPREFAQRPIQNVLSVKGGDHKTAYTVLNYVLHGPFDPAAKENLPAWQSKASYFLAGLEQCDRIRGNAMWSSVLHDIGALLAKNADSRDVDLLWERLLRSKCVSALGEKDLKWIRHYKAVSSRNVADIARTGWDCWRDQQSLSNREGRYLLHSILASSVVLGDAERGKEIIAAGTLGARLISTTSPTDRLLLTKLSAMARL